MKKVNKKYQLTIDENSRHYRFYRWWKDQPGNSRKDPPRDLCDYRATLIRAAFFWFFRRGAILEFKPWAFCLIMAFLAYVIIGSIISEEIRQNVIIGIITLFFIGVITLLWNGLKWLATVGWDRAVGYYYYRKNSRRRKREQKKPPQPKPKGTPFWKLIWVSFMSQKSGSRFCPLITLPEESEASNS